MSDEQPTTLPINCCPECGAMILDKPVYEEWHVQLKQAITLSNIGLGGFR